MKKKVIKNKNIIMFLLFVEFVVLCLLVYTYVNGSGDKNISMKGLLSQTKNLKEDSQISTKYINNRLYGVVSPFLKSFIKHEQLVYLCNSKKIDADIINNKTPVPQITKTPEKEKMKYYLFSLGYNSYNTECYIDSDISVSTGIKDNTDRNLIVKKGGELTFGSLRLVNDYVEDPIDIKKILNTPLIIKPQKADKPNILIYHTHTSEGYCLTEEDKLNNVNTSSDTEINVVKPGNIITQILNSKYGINTLHDVTVHDKGYNHNIAYDLSKKTISDILKDNDTIKLSIDIHRDGANIGNKKFGPIVTYNNKDYAQIMFVIGSDYDINNANPNWEENFKLAMLLNEKLQEKVPGISKGISMRRDPYNENVAEKGLLIEIGFNGNLVSEVSATAEILGEVIGEIFSYNQ